MSVFRKILDKLGLHKEQGKSAVTGTTEVASPDPLSTTPTAASKAASKDMPVPPAARSGGDAPTSDLDFKDTHNKSSQEKSKY